MFSTDVNIFFDVILVSRLLLILLSINCSWHIALNIFADMVNKQAYWNLPGSGQLNKIVLSWCYLFRRVLWEHFIFFTFLFVFRTLRFPQQKERLSVRTISGGWAESVWRVSGDLHSPAESSSQSGLWVCLQHSGGRIQQEEAVPSLYFIAYQAALSHQEKPLIWINVALVQFLIYIVVLFQRGRQNWEIHGFTLSISWLVQYF